jgi:basic membrane protein A
LEEKTMNKKHVIALLLSLTVIASLVLGACQTPAEPTPEPEVVKETVVVEQTVKETVVVEVEKKAMGEGYKLATIFPGVITDADYNTLGYLASTAVQTELGVDFAYSEAVAVPDVERVMREYIDQGFNIIFAHGGQFLGAVVGLAPQFPEVAFICEVDGPIENQPANLWLIDRNFHTPYYVIGYIAAASSKTGKIGYLAGLSMPFTNQEAHAIDQAIADNGLTVEVVRAWSGDFNDPTKGRQLADQMIGQNVDFIMGSMNLGMLGLFEAAKAASTDTKTILVSAKYIDKTNFAPKNYVTSALYDYTPALRDIVTAVIGGTMGGYYNLEFGKGVNIQMPLKNVDPAVQAKAEQIIADIIAGKIVVEKNSTPYE